MDLSSPNYNKNSLTPTKLTESNNSYTAYGTTNHDNIKHTEQSEKDDEKILEYNLVINILTKPAIDRTKEENEVLQKVLSATRFFQTILDPKININTFFKNVCPHLEIEVYHEGTIIQNFGQNIDKFGLILKGSICKFMQKTNREIEAEAQELQELEEKKRSDINPMNLKRKKLTGSPTLKKPTAHEKILASQKGVTIQTKEESKSPVDSFIYKSNIKGADKQKTLIGGSNHSEEMENSPFNLKDRCVSVVIGSPRLKEPVIIPFPILEHQPETQVHGEDTNNHPESKVSQSDYEKKVFNLWHSHDTNVDELCSNKSPIEPIKFVKKIGFGEYFGEQFHRAYRPKNIAHLAVEDTQIMTLSREEFTNIEQNLLAIGKEKMEFFESVFPLWPQDRLTQFAKYFHQQEVKRNSILFDEDDPANALYILKSGEIILYKLLNNYEKLYEDNSINAATSSAIDQYKKSINGSISSGTKEDHRVKKEKKITLKITSITRGQIFGEEPLISLKQRKFLAQASNSGAVIYSLNEADLPQIINLFGDLMQSLYEESCNKFNWRYSRILELIKNVKINENDNDISNIVSSIRDQMLNNNPSSSLYLKPYYKNPESGNSTTYDDYILIDARNRQQLHLSKAIANTSRFISSGANITTGTSNTNSNSIHLRHGVDLLNTSSISNNIQQQQSSPSYAVSVSSGLSSKILNPYPVDVDNAYGILPTSINAFQSQNTLETSINHDNHVNKLISNIGNNNNISNTVGLENNNIIEELSRLELRFQKYRDKFYRLKYSIPEVRSNGPTNLIDSDNLYKDLGINNKLSIFTKAKYSEKSRNYYKSLPKLEKSIDVIRNKAINNIKQPYILPPLQADKAHSKSPIRKNNSNIIMGNSTPIPSTLNNNQYYSNTHNNSNSHIECDSIIKLANQRKFSLISLGMQDDDNNERVKVNEEENRILKLEKVKDNIARYLNYRKKLPKNLIDDINNANMNNGQDILSLLHTSFKKNSKKEKNSKLGNNVNQQFQFRPKARYSKSTPRLINPIINGNTSEKNDNKVDNIYVRNNNNNNNTNDINTNKNNNNKGFTREVIISNIMNNNNFTPIKQNDSINTTKRDTSNIYIIDDTKLSKAKSELKNIEYLVLPPVITKDNIKFFSLNKSMEKKKLSPSNHNLFRANSNHHYQEKESAIKA